MTLGALSSLALLPLSRRGIARPHVLGDPPHGSCLHPHQCLVPRKSLVSTLTGKSEKKKHRTMLLGFTQPPSQLRLSGQQSLISHLEVTHLGETSVKEESDPGQGTRRRRRKSEEERNTSVCGELWSDQTFQFIANSPQAFGKTLHREEGEKPLSDAGSNGNFRRHRIYPHRQKSVEVFGFAEGASDRGSHAQHRWELSPRLVGWVPSYGTGTARGGGVRICQFRRQVCLQSPTEGSPPMAPWHHVGATVDITLDKNGSMNRSVRN